MFEKAVQFSHNSQLAGSVVFNESYLEDNTLGTWIYLSEQRLLDEGEQYPTAIYLGLQQQLANTYANQKPISVTLIEYVNVI